LSADIALFMGLLLETIYIIKIFLLRVTGALPGFDSREEQEIQKNAHPRPRHSSGG
jgi:hypothetical protein